MRVHIAALAVALSAILGCAPKDTLPAQPTSTTEFRISEDLPAPGLRRAIFHDSLGDRRLYLRPDAVLYGLDIEKVMSEKADDERYSLHLTLTAAGAKVLGDATEGSVGKRLAIIVDGEIIAAPVIRQAIRARRCTISGIHGAEKAENLARRIRASIPR